MTDELLKSFILYTQALEVAYHEWKGYWLNYYMNQGKDLYKAFDPIDLWSKNLNHQKNNFGY